ncbi:MAG TPA: pyridoxal 5'-phosphate synthase glutaminase subunit PdxT [Archaeoglobus profundus]|nr:pyridoxal 5'-phosphate synthase glutaminase subunit PdxT [Archaeoglobus profundus]HIP58611.1 pyridoxal 5'-phosphate synthase glutaminase subunit PdxT [Archaeoglobus profundus]
MRIAVVGVQGAVEEHVLATKKAMEKLNIEGEVIAVRKYGIISKCDGVIIPGGESTTISRLIFKDSIASEIIEVAKNGCPIMGTCAGLILLAKHGDEQVKRTRTKLLGLLDVWVKRNAFGRQRESFQVKLNVKNIGEFEAVFIRAPAIIKVEENVDVLATFEDYIVAVQQDNILGLAFHPELTDDTRIHEYFLRLV